MQFRLIGALAIVVLRLCAQPVPTTIAYNDASLAPPGVPNAGVAQGARFVVFGLNFGPQTQVVSQTGALSLGGTSARVTVSGTTLDVPLLLVSRAAIVGVLPAATPLGTGGIQITVNGQTSPRSAPIEVVATAFGLYSRNTQGNGPGQIENVEEESRTPNSLIHPAKPGGRIAIAGTGLGQGEPEITILVGGKPGTLLSRGQVSAGLDEIVAQIPPRVDGCYVPVAVKVGDVVSNYVSVAIENDAGVCAAPGIGSVLLEKLRKEAPVTIGYGQLLRFQADYTSLGLPFDLINDFGGASFKGYLPAEFLASWGPLAAPSPGYCTVLHTTDSLPPTDSGDATELDAGLRLSISGPKGALALPARSTGFFEIIGEGAEAGGVIHPASVLFYEPGEFAISNLDGGRNVGAFTAKTLVGEPFRWTNRNELNSIDRTRDLTVKWSGADPDGFVIISGGGAISDFGGSMFQCTAKGSTGEFSIPASILASLPKMRASLDVEVEGLLWVTSVPGFERSAFQAPGLDAAFLQYTHSIGKPIAFE